MDGIDIGKAYVRIEPAAKGIGKKIGDTLGEESGQIDKASKKAGKESGESLGNGLISSLGGSIKTVGSTIISGIGTAVKTTATIAATGFATATAAVAKFGSEALSSYANYEQLAGGVEKLYGDAADKLKNFADQAYMTSGMSANKYMETATSFSAALINSLGGDVNKAADLTDVAMRAISDNVNVFGSDMQSVTNAFQGFAKQNYTMLDNLKLGYGGTKEEMARLIDDANAYRASIGETADLSINSFADIVLAIQSIQEAQNIADTTNKEAMRTIEGAANATKAAWENVITAIGRGEGLENAFEGLTTAIFGEDEETGLLNQIIPRISIVMEGIGNFIEKASPYITEKIPELINAVLPTLITGGMTLLSAFASGFIDALPQLLWTLGDVVRTILDKLVDATANSRGVIIHAIGLIIGIFAENYMQFINVGFEILTNIIQGMTKDLDFIIADVLDIITYIGKALIEYAPVLMESIGTIIESLQERIIQFLPDMLEVGVTLLETIMQGLVDATANSGGFIMQVIDMIVGIFTENGPQLIDLGANILLNLINGLIASIPILTDNITNIIEMLILAFNEHFPEFVQVGVTLITTLANSLATNISILIPPIIDAITMIVTTLTQPETLTQLLNAALTIIMAIADGLIEALPQLVDAAILVIENLATFLIENIDKLIDAALEIISALADGILKALPVIVPAVIEIVSRIVEKLTEPETLDNIVNAAVDIILALADGLINSINVLLPAVVNIILKLTERLTQPDMIVKLVEAALQIIMALAQGLIKAIPELLKAIPQIIVNIFNAIMAALPKIFEAGGELLLMFKDGIIDNIDNLKQAGIDLVNGLWEGIHDKWGDFVQGAIDLGNDFLEVVKWIFGIASPSKEFAQIGRYCVAGFNNAFDDFGDEAINDVKSAMDEMAKIPSPSVDFESTFNESYNPAERNKAVESGRSVIIEGGITIPITQRDGQDAYELAHIVADVINQEIYQVGAAYA